MTEVKRARIRPSLGIILSLGCMVLGIAGLVWAGLNIGARLMRPDVASAGTGSGLVAPAVASMKPQEGYADSAVPSAPAPQVLYPVRPAVGDPVGTLLIPALGQTLPIVEGTGDNELKQGVGHYVQSVLPGEADNCVLSAHRDTHFSGLEALKIGDRLTVQTVAGTFTYEISNVRIVDKDDRTVIVPTDRAVLTLSTCYPFNYVGSAPDRYIISADVVAP
ncbi:MAG: class D sortase [Coriobacteriia bacterium]|nr:class D sortase [Coriobacteriia bacterium]